MKDYSQWFPGKENMVSDALLRDDGCSDKQNYTNPHFSQPPTGDIKLLDYSINHRDLLLADPASAAILILILHGVMGFPRCMKIWDWEYEDLGIIHCNEAKG